jgi:hypothetical protein
MKRQTKKDKELADRSRFAHAWRRYHAEQLAEAFAGIHGAVFERLMEQLKNLGEARALVDTIAREDWSTVSAADRFVALHEIDTTITKLREKRGLAPFDDPLPGQPDNAFRIIKAMFKSFPPSAGRPAESILGPTESDENA